MNDTTNIIVDCDAGIDDALALFLLLIAHKHERLHIEAVTCVFGNTVVKNVVNNVYRVLELFEDYDIPVHRGAHSPLNSNKYSPGEHECYHGVDGFGDVYTNEPDTSKMQTTHAAYALNKYITDKPGLVSLVCLGPLTNIALAIKLYPDFACSLKNLFVMGGNSTGLGNVTSQAEFNFFCDPESASIVFNNVCKPIYLLPWETCLKSRITYDWRKNILGTIDSSFVQMLNKTEDGCECRRKGKSPPYYVMCDAILAGIILRPEMARNIFTRFVDVELHGTKTRGQVVIDHLKKQEINVHLIDDFDSEIFKELLLFAVNPREDKSVLFPQSPEETSSENLVKDECKEL
ncbi:PREDICTED: probable uridine nucleosidase 1 [Dinoponera quadriceps]|uniref:Probable uridine nucleosidase 1 n=1 Tax=Dinoponera quadriceps TaxID=609295 RepID=A0A6P3X4E7_DINQU|nr:PREDICTED: probable uridine nucleosidase 1 [Dinoponera quadriceps]